MTENVFTLTSSATPAGSDVAPQQLVANLGAAGTLEDDVLEALAAIVGAAIVEAKDDVALSLKVLV